MKTKIKQSFLLVESKRVISKTYGGSTYTLQIYENNGVGKIVHIGEVTACTRGHKGEESEAFTRILQLQAIKPVIKKQIDRLVESKEYKNYGFDSYYTYRLIELVGLEIKKL